MAQPAERRLSLVEIVGSEFCVAIDDGQRVHTKVADTLDAGLIAAVSFSDVRRLTTAFLNAAIGQLYNEYEEEFIREHLRVVDATQQDLVLLKRVVDNAKVFFSDPRRAAAVIKKLTDEE